MGISLFNMEESPKGVWRRTQPGLALSQQGECHESHATHFQHAEISFVLRSILYMTVNLSNILFLIHIYVS